MNSDSSTLPRDPAFDGTGHLSDLSLDRLHLDGPDADRDFMARVAPHMATCAACTEALSERIAADASFRIGPRAPARRGAEVVPLRPRPRRGALIAATGVLAAAAVALLVVRPWAPTPTPPVGDPVATGEGPDVIRIRGGALDFEVQIDDGGARRAVSDGAPVKAGDRAGFAVRTRAPGFVMIVGWDATGAVYLAHPAAGADPLVTEAEAIGVSAEPVRLATAVELDATPGTEHLAAVHCPTAFRFAALAATVDAPTGADALRGRLAAGCTLRELRLEKAGAPR